MSTILLYNSSLRLQIEVPRALNQQSARRGMTTDSNRNPASKHCPTAIKERQVQPTRWGRESGAVAQHPHTSTRQGSSISLPVAGCGSCPSIFERHLSSIQFSCLFFLADKGSIQFSCLFSLADKGRSLLLIRVEELSKNSSSSSSNFKDAFNTCTSIM